MNSPNIVSFIVIVRNDLPGFIATFSSITAEAKIKDKIIIVDGSDDNIIVNFISNEKLQKDLSVKILRDNKRGVFFAQNLGIEAASDWICVINSGDIFVINGRSMIEEVINNNIKVDCHIFSQQAFDVNGNQYNFTPDEQSLWPHQSIVIHKSIHDLFGYYNTDFKYGAEQYFFAKIRSKISYKIHNDILTKYLLGGLSSKINYIHCREIYIIRRTLGCNVLNTVWLSIISPILRVSAEMILGKNIAIRIKVALRKRYSSVDPLA